MLKTFERLGTVSELRWPVSSLDTKRTLINVALRIKRPYMITPKGKSAGGGPRAISIYTPYIVLAAVPLGAIWLFDASAGSGFRYRAARDVALTALNLSACRTQKIEEG